jgi:hypothetical protein
MATAEEVDLREQIGAEREKKGKGLLAACLLGDFSHVHQHHPIPPNHIIIARELPTAPFLTGKSCQ